MCPATNIHQGVCFSWSGGPLQEVLQRDWHVSPSPLVSISPERGSRKLEWLSLTKDDIKAFERLKHVCMTVPVSVFTNYTKPFLLETDACKDGLGAVLSQRQVDGQYLHKAYVSRSLMPHEKNYQSTKLKFLALKWAVTKHFKECLPYQPFVVWMDNNLLTPNLAATGHQWFGALAKFNFELEYKKGHDNMVSDVFSEVTTWLDPETVKSILNGVTLGKEHWAEVHNPAMVECN